MPAIPLDVWISISERLPWEGPVKLIYRNTLKELPCADPKVTLFTALSAVAHEISGEVLNVLGGLAKVTINLGIIGPPASGKTSIPSHILEKLHIKRVGSRSSPEGIGRLLSEEGAVVHLCDEVQQIFRGRRKDEYVGALIDLWKSAFIKTSLTMARRSSRKTIDIPSSAKLTVIWTATEDDLEKVSEVIDTALLRRFLILRTTTAVDPLIKGEEMNWDEVKACMKFINSFKWRFKVEVGEEVMKFRDGVADLFSDKLMSKVMLSEYGVRIACTLAVDRVLSDLLKRARKDVSRNPLSLSSVEGLYHALLSEFQTIALSRQTITTNASDPAIRGETQSSDNHKSITDASVRRIDGGDQLYTETTPSTIKKSSQELEVVSTSEERIIDKSDESTTNIPSILLSRYISSISTLLSIYVSMSVYQKPPSVDVHQLIDFIEKWFWRSPTFSSEDMSFIDVYVPQEYVILGITLTALALIDTSDFVRWFGWDEDWLYFVRRCYELTAKLGEFSLRTLSRYLSRIRRYSEIKEYLERALDAGYLAITKCEDAKDVSKCWFRAVD